MENLIGVLACLIFFAALLICPILLWLFWCRYADRILSSIFRLGRSFDEKPSDDYDSDEDYLRG